MPVTGAVVMGAAQVINGTVNSLMQNKVYKSQANALDVQSRVSQLSNQQQNVLAIRLQNAQTDTERMQILQSSLSDIAVAGVNTNASNTYATGLMIFGSILLLIGATYFLTRKD